MAAAAAAPAPDDPLSWPREVTGSGAPGQCASQGGPDVASAG